MTIDVWDLWTIIAKFILYFGILFSAGTIFYRVLFETSASAKLFRARHLTVAFASAGLFAAIFSYEIRAASVIGEWAGLVDWQMLSIVWQTSAGTALALRVAGLTLIILSTFLTKFSLSLGALGSIIALTSFTQVGHATDISGWLISTLLLIHLIGISFWLGILFPLYRMSIRAGQFVETAKIAHQFGQIAVLFVPLLLIAGAWCAYLLLGTWEALITTAYGRTLGIKILAVTVLLALGAVNKLRLAPAMRAGDQSSLAKLHRVVSIEIFLVFAVLITTAILTSILTLPENHS